MIILGIYALIFMSSCSVSKNLTDVEALLKKNEIKIEGQGIDKTTLETELALLYLQKPNTTFFGIPREWIYFASLTDSTSSSTRKYINTKVGQPPSIYNPETTANTALIMQKYLSNKKGYYDGIVDYETKQEGKEVTVTYKAKLGTRSYISSIEYLTDDERLLSNIEEVNKTSKRLKAGDPIDEQLFNIEKNRLSYGLQNRGYASFATNYIQTYADSSNNPKALDIIFKIQPPLTDSIHPLYTIGDIRIFPDYIQNIANPVLSIDTLEGIYYHRMLENELVDARILNHSNYIEKNKVYNRRDRRDTYRKLSKLGVYKFINISTKQNKRDSTKLDVNMYLTPYKNKWISDFGTDLFYAVLNQQKKRILGFAFNSQLQNRNLFGGAEQLHINASFGSEVQLSQPISFRSQSYGLQTNLKIPRLIDLSIYGRGLDALSTAFNNHRSFKDEATTSIGLSLNHVNLVDYYSISNIGASYAYNYQPEPQTKLVVKQMGLDYNRYSVQDSFRRIISNNPLLQQSFQNTLMTGMILKDVSLFLGRGTDNDRYTQAMIANIDMSGIEVYGINALYNAIAGSNDTWTLNDGIGFAKYIKADIDYRFYTRFNKRHSIASRLFAGIAVPIGNKKSVPFIKQYSVGGPNSMRAWNQKELGPGSYDSRGEYLDNKPYYQQGDIHLEANVEYRFDAFWLVEGALFAEAGNVWTLYPSTNYDGGKISTQFYEDIAVAAGYGFRLDFTYFNIRFDFGYKIRRPYEASGKKWASWSQIRSQGLGNFQVAVNYPF